ncbi:helix-turn-helix transcriptional regulator [Aneurinibacillus sp. BA2021]|nr:helix-turn-helix transcriptional regulator [Aneurinibacillus sp. BA2021]
MLAQRLRQARKAKGYTQEDLAKLVNTKKTTISNYETKYSTPSNEMLIDLANVLETTTDFLLGRTDDPSPKKTEKEMSLFFYDGLEGFEDLSPEEQKAFHEHMREEAKQALDLVKKLKKQGKKGGWV